MVELVFPSPIEEEIEGSCPVCGEALVPKHYAYCQRCLLPFHMRMTETDEAAKDCGIVFLGDEQPDMAFLCYNCSEAQGMAGPPTKEP